MLRKLPLALAPILLREMISYDWKMPAERRELMKQFTYLSALTPGERTSAMAGFRNLKLNSDLAAMDWVNDPVGFMEKLTASLWSTHQMDHFDSLADAYSSEVNSSVPDQEPAQPRLGIAIIGTGAKQAEHPLLQKLKPFGVRLTAVKPEDGVADTAGRGCSACRFDCLDNSELRCQRPALVHRRWRWRCNTSSDASLVCTTRAAACAATGPNPESDLFRRNEARAVAHAACTHEAHRYRARRAWR